MHLHVPRFLAIIFTPTMSKSQTSKKRTVSLQVIHLSMPRTGSLSMKAAYEKLGLPTYHGFDFIDNPQHQILWEKAIDAKWYAKGKPFSREEFDSFLGEYAVLSDVPVIGFSEELLEAYPEAKVVLVDRDIDRWYTSFDEQVISGVFDWKAQILENFIDPFMAARPATLIHKEFNAYFRCYDQKSFQEQAKLTYQRHYADIRRLVPKERLLDYTLGSGWGPLCEFLSKEVPDEPFPWLNESKEMKIWMQKILKRELKKGLKALAGYLVIPAAAVCASAIYMAWPLW